MKIGTGQMIITPPLGISLAGFSAPGRKADAILDDLELSVLVLENENKRVLFICADLLSFSNR
jgi:hypothetical protein